MAEYKVQGTCPKCGEDVMVNVDIPVTALPDNPETRSKITPVGNILVYRITSEEIKQFIIQKSRKYVPDVKIEVVPCYCERKRRKDNEPHRSYASLSIAFSENIMEQKDTNGWYGKIGENNSHVRVVKGLFENIIQMYRYNPKDIDKWLSSYKILEELEDTFGMTEAYIRNLKAYSVPRRVQTSDRQWWIIFSAAANSVIKDMLTDRNTNEPIGRIQIQDIHMLSQGICEFIVYVHPDDMRLQENPHVRQILLGEEKPKKS